MEIECQKCIGKYICAGEHLRKCSMCKKFHKALESKLHSHNKSSFQFPNILEVIDYCNSDNANLRLCKCDISLIKKAYNFIVGNKKR